MKKSKLSRNLGSDKAYSDNDPFVINENYVICVLGYIWIGHITAIFPQEINLSVKSKVLESLLETYGLDVDRNNGVFPSGIIIINRSSILYAIPFSKSE